MDGDRVLPVSRPGVDFTLFADDVGARVGRALVATYGSEVGHDIAADVLAYAFENWERVQSMENPAGYLFRVGQSRSRRYRHRPVWFPPVPVEERHEVAYDLPAAIAKLSARQRLAVVLVHAHGYTLSSAAETLGVSVSTLRNHLDRGMRRLRKELGEESR
jgi:DNA-directed RNA polymerase specialized sigma24 family protein